MSIHDTPKPIRADAARNRTRLLDAARIAFASEAPVSLKQIARDTGVGIATLYRHFPTREALIEAIYEQELDQLCAQAETLLHTEDPAHALRIWMDRFADYASTRRERADALRAVLASDVSTASPAHAQLCAAVQAILAAGTTAGTLRGDVHAEDIVVTLVGMFTTTSPAGERDQLGRMLDLLMDAVRWPGPRGLEGGLRGFILACPSRTRVGVGCPATLFDGIGRRAHGAKRSGSRLHPSTTRQATGLHGGDLPGLASARKGVRRVEFVGAIPKSASGKILRKDLRSPTT